MEQKQQTLKSDKTKQDLASLWWSSAQEKMTGYNLKFLVNKNKGYINEMRRVCTFYDSRVKDFDIIEVLQHIDGSITFVEFEDFRWVFLVIDNPVGYWTVKYADLFGRPGVRMKKELVLS